MLPKSTEAYIRKIAGDVCSKVRTHPGSDEEATTIVAGILIRELSIGIQQDMHFKAAQQSAQQIKILSDAAQAIVHDHPGLDDSAARCAATWDIINQIKNYASHVGTMLYFLGEKPATKAVLRPGSMAESSVGIQPTVRIMPMSAEEYDPKKPPEDKDKK